MEAILSQKFREDDLRLCDKYPVIEDPKGLTLGDKWIGE